MKIFLLLASLIWLGSCATLSGHRVSIIELNGHPQNYAGQQVTVRGYLLGGPEPIAVVTEPGIEYKYEKLASECLSIVNFGELDGELGTELDGKFVEVTGIFDRGTDSYGISFTSCGLTGLDIGGDPVNNIRVVSKDDK